jgi:hypothetical protein
VDKQLEAVNRKVQMLQKERDAKKESFKETREAQPRKRATRENAEGNR